MTTETFPPYERIMQFVSVCNQWTLDGTAAQVHCDITIDDYINFGSVRFIMKCDLALETRLAGVRVPAPVTVSDIRVSILDPRFFVHEGLFDLLGHEFRPIKLSFEEHHLWLPSTILTQLDPRAVGQECDYHTTFHVVPKY